MDRGAWQAAVHGVAKSQTTLSMYKCRLSEVHQAEVPLLLSSWEVGLAIPWVSKTTVSS